MLECVGGVGGEREAVGAMLNPAGGRQYEKRLLLGLALGWDWYKTIGFFFLRIFIAPL